MSSFSGLNTATTALWAQRRGLDVTGQNIANVNTEGYSRQRADLQSVGGTPVPAFYSVGRAVGSGVDVAQVSRIRDSWLEGRAHTERAANAGLAARTEAYTLIEQATREPGDHGIQSLLSDYWAGWGDVANNPQDEPARSQLLQRAQTLVSGMAATRHSVDSQWAQAHDNLGALVSDVNASAADVAGLNRAIQRAVQTGQPANELADRRDLLVMTLAEKIGATVRPGEDGVLNVQVGGITLVAGSTATALALAGPATPDAITATDRPRLVSVPGGSVATVGGTAGGQLDVLTTIVPEFRTALDAVAARLVDQVNALHRQGHGLDGVAGRDLLGPVPGPVTAANVTVLVTDPRQVGAAAHAPDGAGASADGDHADAIAQLRLAAGSPDALYRGSIVELGVQAAVSKRNLEIQTTVAANVDAARLSEAGVNLDEEMANMLQFQHAYSAAARMVTTIDQALDVLINRMGVVGR